MKTEMAARKTKERNSMTDTTGRILTLPPFLSFKSTTSPRPSPPLKRGGEGENPVIVRFMAKSRFWIRGQCQDAPDTTSSICRRRGNGVLPTSEIRKIWLWKSQTTPRSLAFRRAAGHRPALRGLGQQAGDESLILSCPLSRSSRVSRFKFPAFSLRFMRCG